MDLNDLAKIADLEMQRIVDGAHLKFGWSTWMDIDDVAQFQLKRLTFLAEESNRLASLVRKKHKLPEFGEITAF